MSKPAFVTELGSFLDGDTAWAGNGRPYLHFTHISRICSLVFFFLRSNSNGHGAAFGVRLTRRRQGAEVLVKLTLVIADRSRTRQPSVRMATIVDLFRAGVRPCKFHLCLYTKAHATKKRVHPENCRTRRGTEEKSCAKSPKAFKVFQMCTKKKNTTIRTNGCNTKNRRMPCQLFDRTLYRRVDRSE